MSAAWPTNGTKKMTNGTKMEGVGQKSTAWDKTGSLVTKMEGWDKNGRLGQKWKAWDKMEGTIAGKSCAGQMPE